MTLSARLAEHEIRLRSYHEGSQKVTCPRCSHQRRNKADPCLSITIDDDGATWHCHHCDWSGGVRDRDEPVQFQPRRRAPKPRPAGITIGALSVEAAHWFKARGIELDTLQRAEIGCAPHWMPASRAEVPCIAFPYHAEPGGPLVNAKYRAMAGKEFSQVKDGEKVFWRLDQADRTCADHLVIVEGEIDALSLMQAGIDNVVSVPDGAPKKVRDGAVDPADDRKFSFVHAAADRLAEFGRIILAVDNDEPGHALAEELARRIGRERCWSLSWPDGCKDANDVLVKHGAEALAACIDEARPHPIKALIEAGDFAGDVLALYRQGRRRGAPTGWSSVTELYSVAPGQLTVVTGVPNSGKSEWVDALMVNLAETMNWRFALCSFENPPDEHVTKLVEKRLRKPFFDGPRARMTEAELSGAIDWVADHFSFIRADDDAPTIDWLLETATGAVLRYGIRGLVIDPYNEIEHRRGNGQTETEYVSQMLGKVRRFAVAHGVHVWFIAHPAKMLREGGKIPVPSLYDISGSANWVNKADVGIVVHRQPGEGQAPTEIYVKKVRFKWVGLQGMATLDYDRATGTYAEPGRRGIGGQE